ncbi:MAG: hypothetical protein HC900_00205 [Methylacidiphilales bacterium]|nr:hypothetical protein [Candidatus Methylacidiphilales bacterium]
MSNLPALRDRLKQSRDEFAKQLPAHIPPDKFVRTAQTAVFHTRNIDKVTNVKSLLIACSKAAADGLILDGREAALVVNYKGEVEYRPMMRGLLKLAWQSGAIKAIVVELVRDKDIFSHEPTNPARPISHIIDHRAERGEVFAVYAIAELKDGGIVHEVMSVHDVNRIRDRSDGYKAFKAGKIKENPWNSDWPEMGRKTVFRRISKYLPSSPDREGKDPLRAASERIDEDYSFAPDAETGEPKTAPRQAGKRRGAAAALLKDVTPSPAASVAQEAEAAALAGGVGDIVDLETGEVLEAATVQPGDAF